MRTYPSADNLGERVKRHALPGRLRMYHLSLKSNRPRDGLCAPGMTDASLSTSRPSQEERRGVRSIKADLAFCPKSLSPQARPVPGVGEETDDIVLDLKWIF